MKSISLFGLLVLFAGCSLFAYKNSKNTIYIENTATIKYTGKGAGASFALMGAMGPMGAAIGIAIDEGISKDIRKNVEISGFDLVGQLCKQYQKKEIYCTPNADEAREILVVRSIELISKGSDDRMQVSIKAECQADGIIKSVELNSGETNITLEQAKFDNGSIFTLFEAFFIDGFYFC